ncbi:hypothetical protein B0A52_08725 [Exophiala mesophila]|uniref:Putative phospholipase n=1 Tax=Exophiala mesophila TaxID=212818 RepID=A0A438MWT3_EXOME|nr:hypothetical protein B0A52_08725 [Exophiala mesophila]
MVSFFNPLPSLPQPLGPYKVGTSEWEIPVSEIPSTAKVPDSKISTIKFRLYYPTTDSTPSKSIKWLPSPQRQWVAAYSSFLGASTRVASWISAFPSLLNYTTISATPDAELRDKPRSSHFPLAVFSHGLGGNYNTYSAVCASLASYGVVCVAPEHRDGSAPVSFIRSSTQDSISIPYQKYSHTPTPEVLKARNAQLRIRLWELDNLFTALTSLHQGQTFTNYALPTQDTTRQSILTDALDLRPGRVTWAGHSFGAATIVQFVKSVYYRDHVPSLEGTPHENNMDWHPLYTPADNGHLVQQITPDSPVALLDLWTTPLRDESTKWMLERPMPCHHRDTALADTPPNTVAILSAEFNNYIDLKNRTIAVLSRQPADAMIELERRKAANEASSTKPTPDNEQSMPTITITSPPPPPPSSSPHSSTSTSRDVSPHSSASPASSTTSFAPSTSEAKPSSEASQSSTVEPHLYLIPNSAHLSQSDFGLLFPNFTRYLMNAQDPHKTIELNVRAILAVMRGQGLPVSDFTTEGGPDRILGSEGLEKRFVRIPLV